MSPVPVPFASLGVPDDLVAALAAEGIVEPFPIQAATIPDALAGRDLCGRAPTGSGKTLAFGIPLVARATRAAPHRPTALVLVPTRELAAQVTKAIVPLAKARRLFVVSIYGGTSQRAQVESLRRGDGVGIEPRRDGEGGTGGLPQSSLGPVPPTPDFDALGEPDVPVVRRSQPRRA